MIALHSWLSISGTSVWSCVVGRSREQSMGLPRRQFLHLGVRAIALPALSRAAWAQTYPARPVRVIEGFGAVS
jgi:hypothetical protein